jgi:thiol-disulfide isomerase/thioredoxin
MRYRYILTLAIAAARLGSAAAVEAGKPAPPLSLTPILQAPAGSAATWDAFRGKATVLEFWATWCGPCVEAIPHWNKLVERFQDRPIRFLSITDESPELIARFLTREADLVWIGLDGQGKTLDSFMVGARPTTVLVDANGIVRAIGHPKGLTEPALDDLLAGKPVTFMFESGGADTQALPQSIFEISIRPASPISVTHTSPGGRVKYGKGVISYGITLARILSQVYGIPASRVIGEEWVGRDEYDVALVLPGSAVKETDALKIALEMGSTRRFTGSRATSRFTNCAALPAWI